MRLKFLIDLLIFIILLPFLLPMMVGVAVLIRFSSPGPIIYWSKRIGQNNIIFRMPKFRTMRIDTPEVATHLIGDPDKWLTPIGSFLRKTSLDELPQLWSVFKGDMSFVGPRPALFNQDDLRLLRTEAGVHVLTPGITGWAQVKGRDSLCLKEKLKFDVQYLERRSLFFDIRILCMTLVSVLKRDGVSH
jgi:O-antigen biosynthesis protein WbqP